jgi:hypothetical protein
LQQLLLPLDYLSQGIVRFFTGAAAIAGLRLEAEKQRNKTVAKLKIDVPKFYAPLWETISVESKEEIRQHEDYVGADLTQNPNTLWSIIVETHVTAIHGAGPAMRELEIVTLKSKLNNMRQKPNMTIGEFKKDFDDHVDLLPQAELAMMFLTKLDPTRYAQMMAQLTNDATLGRAFPQTLHAAWTIASTWKAASGRVQHGSEMHSVFALADEDRRESGRGRGRGLGRGRGRSEGRQGENGPASEKPSHTVETRTCRCCLQKGHLWASCPDNPSNMESAMVATDDTESVDFDAQ